MQFLKKNYEKILLAVVVLGTLAVVAYLSVVVSHEKQRLSDLTSTIIRQKPKPFPALDLKSEQDMLTRAQTRVSLDFSGSNRLFNPVRWQLDKKGTPFPNPAGREIDQLEVTKLSPLYMIISYDTVSASPGLATHYGLGVTHEAALLPYQRGKKSIYVPMNERTNGFTIVSAEGPAEDPTSLTLELSDTGKRVTITKDRPFKRVEGYTVDLRYPPDNRTLPPNRRVGDVIYFAGESYKIIDIEESEIVLLQQSNQKQWIKPFSLKNSTATAAPVQTY